MSRGVSGILRTMQKKPAKVPVHRAPPPQQVRIIGGAWKRTQLPVIAALGLRPTPDRVRETVFNWIDHLRERDWSGAVCLDLFAGSGALGFEAASRGARAVTMVDSHTPVVRQLEAVKDKLKAEAVTIVRGDAIAMAQTLAARGARFDLLFLDPPYNADFLSRILPLCPKLLAPDALVYVEAGAALPFAPDRPSPGAAASAATQADSPAGVEAGQPDWLAGWELLRADKAGGVFYHLLRRIPDAR